MLAYSQDDALIMTDCASMGMLSIALKYDVVDESCRATSEAESAFTRRATDSYTLATSEALLLAAA